MEDATRSEEGTGKPRKEPYGPGLNIPAMLLQEGYVTAEQIAKAHARQKSNGHKLGYNLIELGFVEPKTITQMLERQFRVRGVDLSDIEVDPAALKLVPAEIANKYEVFPVRRDGHTIVLAMGDPTDWTVIDDLKFLTGYEIDALVADEFSIIDAINRHYEAASGAYRQLLENLGEFEMEVIEDDDEDEDDEKVEQAYTVEVSGRRFDVKVIGPPLPAGGAGAPNGAAAAAGRAAPKRSDRSTGAGGGGDALTSPLQGNVWKVCVEQGQTVEAGQLITIIEAMKMENEITAHKAGTIKELRIEEGGSVSPGDTLAVIADAE
ncbi:MAG: biotin/lipoyl-binding protein [Gemmatimonadetes bacterium]|nr:biotin/lipoyl-binding protein [Gemmatimonadota bacterium]